MTRASNRRRYLRHGELDGLGRGRLDRLQDDIATYGGPPGSAQTTVTFTNVTNTVNATAHGYALNDGPFVLINDATDLPDGLFEGKLYWIAGTVNANDFQLSDNLGGAVVTFADDGTGTSQLCELGEDPV